MVRCKDCKYFGDEIVTQAWYSMEKGHASRIVHTGYHPCRAILHFGGTNSDHSGQDLAVLVDGSGEFAQLRVTPNFGCAMFVSRYEGEREL